MDNFTIGKKTLIDLIEGKLQFTKCNNCNGTGYESWDDNGIISPGIIDKPKYQFGECCHCSGAGYISTDLDLCDCRQC